MDPERKPGQRQACTEDSGAPLRGAVYRPRNPRASPLWQCSQRQAKELREAGRFQRAVEERAIERFIKCGDPHHGFARIYCDACGHDYLLGFSCKTRCFCPSCHQKRVLLYGEWVEENVLKELRARMLAWRHGGFSAHNDVRVAAEDAEGRKKFAGYMLRAPMSLQKMTYDAATGTVIYRSKMHAGLKRNFQVMPGAAWLALLCKQKLLGRA